MISVPSLALVLLTETVPFFTSSKVTTYLSETVMTEEAYFIGSAAEVTVTVIFVDVSSARVYRIAVSPIPGTKLVSVLVFPSKNQMRRFLDLEANMQHRWQASCRRQNQSRTAYLPYPRNKADKNNHLK